MIYNLSFKINPEPKKYLKRKEK